jgi:flavin-dependent dehydrogenase
MGNYDVVICGGGVAALLLARHLQLYQPERSILILDSAKIPSPVSCHKVGESIPEGAAYHLRHTLALNEYLFNRHVPKLGFRFFFGGGTEPLAKRLEYGGTQWPPFATFQLDRGIFENDLRAMVTEKGAAVLPQCQVRDITLAEGGAHRVFAEQNGERLEFTSRWVVDATGRRRFLSSKLGLKRSVNHHVSASWWRVGGKVDIGELVDASHTEWHRRVGPPRWHSTNHLVGEGYWMWIIPLISETTSFGIVADERTHPIRERATYEGSLEWFRKHEPEVADLIRDRLPLDFNALKNFAYSTSQLFSHQRWSCIGDAAVLADPLYGLGQDLIGHSVSITAKLIEMDYAGSLTEEVAANYNRMFLSMFGIIMDQYQDVYGTFGSPFLYTQKLAWDSSMYFAVLQQTLMQNIYDNPDSVSFVTDIFERLAPLNRAMQRLFKDSFERDGRLDLLRGMRTWAPRVTVLADSSLDKCAPGRLKELFGERLRHLEGIATAVFGEVIRNSPSIPGRHADRVLHGRVGINPRAVSMNAERWEEDGLFDASYEVTDFDAPAQFDVNFRLEAERRDFCPVHTQFRMSAAKNNDRVAIVGNGARLSYGQVLRRVELLAARLAAVTESFVGVQLAGAADSLQSLLAVLSAGKAFVVFDRDWDEQQCQLVREHCGLEMVLTDETVADLLRDSERKIALGDGAESAACDDIRGAVAFREFRFTEYGPRVVDINHGAFFRMCRWLPLLMKKGLAETADSRDLCFLWAGPARAEMIVPLLLGSRLVAADVGSEDGSKLLRLLEEHEVDIMLGSPPVFQSLVEAGWPVRGLRVVSVGDALPRNLSLKLRSQAQRVCDFGYATFAH